MMKFCMSDHKLMIEEGRHYRPQIPRENRFCNICRDAVEDEQHMLTNCKLYGQRNTWFSEIGRKIPNFINLDDHQKFIFLMTQEDNQLTTEIAKKISDWLNLRDKIISYFFQITSQTFPFFQSFYLSLSLSFSLSLSLSLSLSFSLSVSLSIYLSFSFSLSPT